MRVAFLIHVVRVHRHLFPRIPAVDCLIVEVDLRQVVELRGFGQQPTGHGADLPPHRFGYELCLQRAAVKPLLRVVCLPQVRVVFVELNELLTRITIQDIGQFNNH